MGNVRINHNPANLDKTLALMQGAFSLAMLQTEEIAVLIAQENGEKKQVEALFLYLKKNYKYKEDPRGMEYIRLPAENFKDRKKGIDCEDFSLEAAAILVQLGFVPEYKIVDWDGRGWAHIYVIAHTKTESFVLDAVHESFNTEDTYQRETFFPVVTELPTSEKSLGSPLKDQIRVAQLNLYLVRTEVKIEGANNGWYGQPNKVDKRRLDKVIRYEKELEELRSQTGLGSLIWSMSTPEIKATRDRLIEVRKNYKFGSKQYRDVSGRIAQYGSELDMRTKNGFLDKAPSTSEMLKMQSLRGTSVKIPLTKQLGALDKKGGFNNIFSEKETFIFNGFKELIPDNKFKDMPAMNGVFFQKPTDSVLVVSQSYAVRLNTEFFLYGSYSARKRKQANNSFADVDAILGINKSSIAASNTHKVADLIDNLDNGIKIGHNSNAIFFRAYYKAILIAGVENLRKVLNLAIHFGAESVTISFRKENYPKFVQKPYFINFDTEYGEVEAAISPQLANDYHEYVLENFFYYTDKPPKGDNRKNAKMYDLTSKKSSSITINAEAEAQRQRIRILKLKHTAVK